MAKRKSYQGGGGIYMGGHAMRGERLSDLRDLADAIKAQSRKAEKGFGLRNLFGSIGDIWKMFDPIVGSIADFIIERVAEHNIDVGDPEKIREKETLWTESAAEDYATAFEEAEERATPSWAEAAVGQVTDYLKTEAGKELISGYTGFETPSLGGGGEDVIEGTKARVAEKTTGWATPKQVKSAKGYVDDSIVNKFFYKTNKTQEDVSAFLKKVIGKKINVGKASGTANWLRQSGFLPIKGEGKSGWDTWTLPRKKIFGIFEGGGLVSQSQDSTIADYFSMQGKTLGGSSKQSLAEVLGRK